MKKKLFFLEAGVLIFFVIAFAINVKADPSIMVSDYELSPSVFMPGDEGILTLTVTNGELTSTTTTTETNVQGGFTESTSTTDVNGVFLKKIWMDEVCDGDKEIKASTYYLDVGFLSAGKSITIDFEVIVDEKFTEGVYFPKLKINPTGYDIINYPIKFKVSNNSVDLISKSVPSQVSKSGSTYITLTVMNNRENTVKNVRISPRAISGIEIKPETVIIENLVASSSEDISFSLIPSESGEKNLIFDVSYDNGENEHATYSNFTVDISNKHDVSPIIYTMPSEIEAGNKESVKLKVYNSKTEDISSVIVTPISDAKITPSQYFVGAMDTDDIYSLSFDIDTTGLTANQTYDIGFIVYFKQDGTTFETPAVMSSFNVVKNNENGDQDAIFFGLFLLVLIVIAFFAYRHYKKKRMKRLLSKQE